MVSLKAQLLEEVQKVPRQFAFRMFEEKLANEGISIPPTDPGLVIAHTFTWESCLYASKDYLSKFGRPKSHEELSNHRLVLCGTSLLRTRAFGSSEQFADPDQPATRVENSDSARTIIEQGEGIGQLFCLVGDACQSLERVFPDPFDQMNSWVLYHESARGSAPTLSPPQVCLSS